MNKFNFTDKNSVWYKYAFYAAMGVVFVYMIASSNEYGICWDEQFQKSYGEMLLKYYKSGGVEDPVVKIDLNNTRHVSELYGAWFELTSAVLQRFWSGDPYEFRHFYISLYGILTIFITGLFARELAGWRAGVLGVLFLFLSPVFFGHSMFNSKDIPFAAMFITAVFFIFRFVRKLPEVSKLDFYASLISTAIAINIRIGGLFLIVYMCLFMLIRLVYDYYNQRGSVHEMYNRYKRSIIFVFVFAVLSYLSVVALWPYGYSNPITSPFKAISVFAKYEFDSNALFDGKWLHSIEHPWNYIPTWIWITSPLFICGGILLTPVFLFNKTAQISGLNNKWFALLCLTFFIPVFYIIANKSVIYDGWRHVFFIYPSLVVACALAWDGLIDLFGSRSVKMWIAFGLLILIGEPALWMYKYHPLETFYFGPAIGGNSGAFKKFEIDYYGTSYRNAVEWLAEASDTLQKGPNGKARIRVWYGERESVEHFIKRYDKLELVVANEESADWDYYLVLPAQAKHNHDLVMNWPPKGMIHQVEIDGAPVVAIVKNHRTAVKENLKEFNINTCNDAVLLINKSVQFYQVADYFNCFAACERALTLTPNNVVAYSNTASCFNNLFLFNEAIDYANKALKIDPNFELAKGNLNVARERMAQSSNVSKEGVASNYLNASVVYFNLGKFQQCIDFSVKAVKLNPNLAAAYNNIGASYNALGKFSEAVDAFNQALLIDPNFQLAKNNLEAAKSSMKK